MDEIPAPRLDELDAEARALVELTASRNDDRPLAIIQALAARPELLAPFLSWSAALAQAGALGGRRHELAALRTSWHHGSDYEWGNHVGLAREAGCTDAEIEAMADPSAAGAGLDVGDRALVALVDAMCGPGRVPAEVRGAALDQFGTGGVVELAWTVGQYAGLSMVVDALGLAAERGTPPVPSAD